VRTAIVEPRTANCLFRSAEAGRITEAPPPHPSTMAGLNCGLPSPLTWPDIHHAADVFIGIDDEATYEAMRELASAGIVAGESGAAALGGLLAVARGGSASQRSAAGLSGDAIVLIVNTEGATDPVNYRSVVGADPEQIRAEAERRRSASAVVEHVITHHPERSHTHG